MRLLDPLRADRPPLDEMTALENLIAEHGDAMEVRQVDRIHAAGRDFPLYVLSVGNPAPEAPAVGFFGGVHGVECIGTHALLAFLASLLERRRWDDMLQRQLESVRLVFMPLVNPGGMWLRTRSNPHGVDLMRNAPVDCEGRPPFLLGGQRFSPRIPWYRGGADMPMEPESLALCEAVRGQLLAHAFSIALDCHSGFGMRDRIWFPYARCRTPIPHLADIYALRNAFVRAYPHHDYVFEPQSRQYMAHGDLWDYLYLEALAEKRTFLPLTLEMGSWRWVKKNPLQLFSRLGMYNPLAPHRLHRVLRRHLNWFGFLASAAASYRNWLPPDAERHAVARMARRHWYGETA